MTLEQKDPKTKLYLLCPGFYAGTTPALVAYVSENSVLFTALGQTQKFVARVRGEAAFSCQFQYQGIRQTED